MAKAKPVKKVVRPDKSRSKSSGSSVKAARKVVKQKPKPKAVVSKKPVKPAAGKTKSVTKSVPKPLAAKKVATTSAQKAGSRSVHTSPSASRVVVAKTVSKPEPKATTKSASVAAGKSAPASTVKVMPKPVAADIKPRPPVAPVTAPKPAPGSQAAENPEIADAQRKKGVRKATLTSGIRENEQSRKLGRSRIPVDAPLEVVFQNDMQAREAFMFLGIQSIRDLESFTPDELVLRLTGPAKLTVGRIRKILAMNNRCLTGDEKFALEFQELLNKQRE